MLFNPENGLIHVTDKEGKKVPIHPLTVTSQVVDPETGKSARLMFNDKIKMQPEAPISPLKGDMWVQTGLNPGDVTPGASVGSFAERMYNVEEAIGAHAEEAEEVLSRGNSVLVSPNKGLVKVKRIDGKTIVNLAPPLNSGLMKTKHANLEILSSTKAILRATADHQYSIFGNILVKPNTQYTVDCVRNGTIAIVDGANNSNVIVVSNTNRTFTFNTGSYTSIDVVFSNAGIGLGEFTFDSFSLFEGTQSFPYVANVKGVKNPTIVNETNNTSLVIPTTLHKGEYVEQNAKGELVKYTKYKEIDLDDKITYAFSVSSADNSKAIIIQTPLGYAPESSLSSLRDHKIVKYNGAVLAHDTVTLGDRFNMVDNFRIAIPNADSGWGASYTPTLDEIKAYFLGWKMYDVTGGASTPYNGGNVSNKYWAKIWSGEGEFNNGGVVGSSGTSTLPTIMNDKSYKPYRLIYELASPVMEVIEPYGDLTVDSGENSLKVYEGRIVNEVITPVLVGSSYYVNGDVPGSKLQYTVDKFTAIYKDTVRDSTWNFVFTLPGHVDRYGTSQAIGQNFNANALYTASYEPYRVWEVSAPVEEVLLGIYSGLISNVEQLNLELSQVKDGFNAHVLNTGGKHIHSTGSNANGTWMKFEDGTMICTMILSQIEHTANVQKATKVTFPHQFTEPPHNFISINSVSSTNAFKVLGLHHVRTGWNTFMEIYAQFDVTQGYAFQALSIGRWK